MQSASKTRTPSSRILKKREAITDRIVETASREFASRGYDQTSMNEIADMMGVTGASLYYYFQTKEELLYACVRNVMERLVDLVCSDADANLAAGSRLHRLVSKHVRFDLDNRQLVSFVNAYVYGPRYLVETVAAPYQVEIRRLQREVLEAYRSIVEDGRAAGDFAVADAKLAAFNILAITQYPVLWYRPDSSLSIDDVASEQAEAALRIVGCIHPT